MRPLTAGTALLLAAAVPAVVVLTSGCSSAAPASATSAATSLAAVRSASAASAPSRAAASTTTQASPSGIVPLLGPTPSSWEGGHAVPVAPRWWPQGKTHPSQPWPALWPRPVEFSPTAHGPLSGIVIALDPGHDIGNGRHVSLINKKYWVGLTKICNTTGTATNAGYPEATYNFDVAARLRRLLVAAGATVVVTRDRNSTSTYGPCVGARGAFPVQEHAAFMLQIHADGGPSTGRGFHVIAPAYYKGYTDDMWIASRAFGQAMVTGMKATGFRPSTYLSSVIQVRKDQGGLNTSDVPTVTVETLNMRNAADAAIAMSASGRQKVAAGLYAGILRYARTR